MEPDGQPSFASLLKSYRLARGMSQEELAERAGLSRDAIGLLERGERRNPRRDTVALLAQALGLSADEQARLQSAAVRPREPTSSRAAPSSRPSYTLPLQLTSFVGRERESAVWEKAVHGLSEK